jgi:hypothetical protein
LLAHPEVKVLEQKPVYIDVPLPEAELDRVGSIDLLEGNQIVRGPGIIVIADIEAGERADFVSRLGEGLDLEIIIKIDNGGVGFGNQEALVKAEESLDIEVVFGPDGKGEKY